MDQLRPLQQYLPDGFRYAGVIAFSGAIFSRRGLNYRYDTPAPTPSSSTARPTAWSLTGRSNF